MAALSPSHVTDQGVLVEPFAWMVIGRLSLVAAALGLAVLLVRRLYQQR